MNYKKDNSLNWNITEIFSANMSKCLHKMNIKEKRPWKPRIKSIKMAAQKAWWYKLTPNISMEELSRKHAHYSR